MEYQSTSYISLLIIVLLAAFVPVIIKKIKVITIPLVVGEIVAGMIIGKSGLNIIESSSWLDFISAFGFAFLMFLSGLEIDFSFLYPKQTEAKNKWYQKPLFIAVILFMFTLIISGLTAYGLRQIGWINDVIIMTLILSTTSVGIVVPVLKEKKLLELEYGQILLLGALIADFLTMILITFVVAFYTTGPTYKLLLILLLFATFIIFYRLGIRIVNNKFIKDIAQATGQLEVRGAFALILIFIALAQQLGTEIILGAFLAGAIVSLIKERDSTQLYVKLDAIGYGFFVPIFFIMVGVNFDVRLIIQNPNSVYFLPLLLLAVYAVKLIPSFILRFSYSWKEALGAGFLLSSRLSLIIAASAIGLRLGAISEATNGAIILVAVITSTFSPLIFNTLIPSFEGISPRCVFIIGINDRTLLLAQRLKKSEVKVVMVTSNKDQFEKGLKICDQVYYGKILDANWLQSIGIRKARTVVVDTCEEEINTRVCQICKEILGINHIVLFTNSQSPPESARLFGALTVSPEFAMAFMAESLVLHPKTLSLFIDDDDNLEIVEVELHNPDYFDKPLNKIKLPGDILILSILRNDEKIIPHGNNVLKKGDIVMLVGNKQYIRKVKFMLNLE